MDEAERRQLAMVAAQAGAISEALVHSREEWLDRDDSTFHALNSLIRRAHGVLGDSPEAELLPEEIREQTGMDGVRRTAVMAAAQQLQAALGTLLDQEPGKLEELERDKQALEAKVLEAEARAAGIRDDELHEQCFDLLLRSGRADAAVARACTVLEDRLRSVAGLGPDAYGVNLADTALKKQTGKLVLSDVDAEQEGAQQLYRGVIGFFKNPTSHRVIEDYDLTRARQVVGLIDTLLQLLREAKKRSG